jgi:hypothetical protein
MPANDIVLYAKYDRVAVKLVAQAGLTTVIERGRDTTNYYDWTISGFVGSRIRIDFNTLDRQFVDIVGDGYFTITNVAGSSTGGTGALVQVFDRLDPTKPVEKFFIVYYGDINGDGRINSTDSSLLNTEISRPSWSGRTGQIAYLVKAADLDGNRRVNSTDASLLNTAVSGATINQATGKLQ